VLALEQRAIGVRREAAHDRRAELRGRASGYEIENARKLDDSQSVRIHGRERP
jgi:hypothetical protein